MNRRRLKFILAYWTFTFVACGAALAQEVRPMAFIYVDNQLPMTLRLRIGNSNVMVPAQSRRQIEIDEGTWEYEVKVGSQSATGTKVLSMGVYKWIFGKDTWPFNAEPRIYEEGRPMFKGLRDQPLTGRLLKLEEDVILLADNLEPSPNPSTKDKNKDDPDAAIRRLRSGRYTPLPEPDATPSGASGGGGYIIENGTSYTLYVYVSGPVKKAVSISAGASLYLDLPAGTYDVAAEIPRSRILPFYGRRTYEPNTKYSSHFVVGTR